MTSVQIDFYSDYICPWCYIGKSRLERIQASMKDEYTLDIKLKPFLLYPLIPKGGTPKSHFANKGKFGMGRSLRNEAAIEEIEINYKIIDTIPNSLEAHRLTWLIRNNKKKFAFAKSIFCGYFKDGRNIEDPIFLIDEALKAEVDDDIIELFAKSAKGAKGVQDAIAHAKAEFITLVPCLKINDQFLIPGLQEKEVWEKYIRRAAKISER